MRTHVRRLAVAVLVGSIVGACVPSLADEGPRERETVARYIVRPGDTIWEIARGLVGPEGDPRPMVDTLIEWNGIEDGLILPGQRLRLPG